jgi:two-component system, NarL family, sensor histidine kinase UhpB
LSRYVDRFLDQFLSIPIFHKVLLANSLILVVGAFVGTDLTAYYIQQNPGGSPVDIVVPLIVGGLTFSIVINFVVLKLALSPLDTLVATVEGVRQGDFHARARETRVRDPQTDELRETLNAMLDAVERYRYEVQLLSQAAISAQEEERKRVARELHDETAQSLTSLLVRLRIAERASSVEEMRDAIAEVRELTTRTLDEVRNLAVELRPSALDDLGLVPALRWYTKQYASRHGLAVEFEASNLDERLPSQVELVFYRVIQEALTNVAKHADAQSVSVRLDRSGDVITATIQDDGQGFDVDSTLRSRERGLGLFGMHERLTLVGGDVKVESEAGHGTRVVARVPLGAARIPGVGRREGQLAPASLAGPDPGR